MRVLVAETRHSVLFQVFSQLTEEKVQDEGWWSLLYAACAVPSKDGAKVRAKDASDCRGSTLARTMAELDVGSGWYPLSCLQ